MPQFTKPTNEQLSQRYDYHPPKEDQKERYEKLRAAAKAYATTIRDLTPCSPEQTRALNAVDEAGWLANAAIARNE